MRVEGYNGEAYFIRLGWFPGRGLQRFSLGTDLLVAQDRATKIHRFFRLTGRGEQWTAAGLKKARRIAEGK